MFWVGRALSSVSSYYREINPATLSGAIDVIVVARQATVVDADTGETTLVEELASSPWHVRFGKLSVLRPVERKVHVTINDEAAPFSMKIGETGEAFFVFETDSEVPESLQTSPLAGPMPDDELDFVPKLESPSETTRTNGLDAIPDFDDLGESRAAPSSPGDDVAQTVGGPSSPNIEESGLASKVMSNITKPVSKAALLGKAAVMKVASTSSTMEHQVEKQHRRLDKTNLDDLKEKHTQHFSDMGALEESMRSDLEGTRGDDVSTHEREDVGPDDLGSDVRAAERKSESQLHHEFPSTRAPEAKTFGPIIEPPLQLDSSGSCSKPCAQGKLMLDMAGYKLKGAHVTKAREDAKLLLEESQESFDPEDPERTPSGFTNKHMSRELVPDERIMSFARALLRSADRHKPQGVMSTAGEVELEGFKFPYPREDGELSPSPSTAASPELKPVADFFDTMVTDIETAQIPHQYSLRADGVVHVFELSLCGDEQFGRQSYNLDTQMFLNQRVSFSQLIDQPDLVDDSRLVVKYQSQFLTWENAPPVLASLAIYRRSLSDDYVARVKSQSKGVQARPERSTWSRWWNKSRSETIVPQHIDRTTSPIVSPPASPRSLPDLEIDGRGPTLPMNSTHTKETSADTIKPDLAQKHYAKTLRLTSEQLAKLNLKKGINHVSFSVRSSYSGYAVCTSRIFLWDVDYQICISDIDGTITKSDALGHVFTMIGRDWTHAGVAKLYTDIAKNGYKMLYLTSRAIGQADTTREYLKGINQSGFILPEGPVIMSPDRLMTSLHREVIMRKPEVFKMACLRDIQRLFAERNPFYAGFGNRITDALSYRSVDVPSSRIFTIDSNGEVKMELLELAGYKSSYIHMTDLVDQMFPPINRKAAPEFTDFNHWRIPLVSIDLPNLSPPSPALSARSGDSRLNFRLSSLSLGRRSTPSRTEVVERPHSRSNVGFSSGGGGGSWRTNPSSPLVHPILSNEPDSISDVESLNGAVSDYERDAWISKPKQPPTLSTTTTTTTSSSLSSLTKQSVQRSRKNSIPQTYALDDPSSSQSLHDGHDEHLTEAEKYRRSVDELSKHQRRYRKQTSNSEDEGEEDEEVEEEEEGEIEEGELDDDDFPQTIDFSSVPY